MSELATIGNHPSPTAANGRDVLGRFSAGNKAARGNPLARRVQRLRAEIVRAIGPAEIAAVIASLLEAAKAGDVAACRELLDRAIGKPGTSIPGPDGGPICVQAAEPRATFDSAGFIALLRQQIEVKESTP